MDRIPPSSLFRQITVTATDEETGFCTGEAEGIPFSPGDCICRRFADGTVLTEEDKPCLGILWSGAAAVRPKGEGRSALMRQLTPGSVFGVASLFGDGDAFVTRITALGSCRVLYLSQTYCERLIGAVPDFALRYIAFLTDRIRFLNRRIAAYTASDACHTLLRYLSDNAGENGAVVVRSMSELSELLHIGRASLYRIIEQLEREQTISREGKTIYLLSDPI